MAIADFKPTLGKIELSTSGSILTGNNADFCAKFLNKRAGGAPVGLESLTYVLPGQNREGEGQENQPSVVVNLLMQLRASCDQNNFFLRTGQAAQAQVTARLHQVLGQCSGAARAQAGEIERAIRTRLVQEEEFSRALRKLEREVKKNVSLNQPHPERETELWSGNLFRQEKLIGEAAAKVVVDNAVQSEAEAKTRAEALLNEAAMGFLTGEMEIAGMPPVVPGHMITIEKVDKSFNRDYFITRVVHHMDVEGFETTVQFAGSKV